MALMTNIYADDETYSRDREFEENLGLVGDGKNYIAYSKKTVDVLLGNTLGYAPETPLIETAALPVTVCPLTVKIIIGRSGVSRCL